MKRLGYFAVSILLVLAWLVPACAERSADCEAVVRQCADMFKEKGNEATLQAINDSKGPFVKGDIYIFALSMDNVMVAHPHERLLKRMPMNNIKDNNGVFFFQKFKEIAEKQGSGWVEYLWAKPGEKEASPKRSFIMKVPGENLYIGAGYYLK